MGQHRKAPSTHSVPDAWAASPPHLEDGKTALTRQVRARTGVISGDVAVKGSDGLVFSRGERRVNIFGMIASLRVDGRYLFTVDGRR